jgi:hypothetical protein
VKNDLYGALSRARNTANYLAGEGNRHDRNRFNEVLDGLLPNQVAARAGGSLDSA